MSLAYAELQVTIAENELEKLMFKFREFGAEESEPENAVETARQAARAGDPFPNFFTQHSNPFGLYTCDNGWEKANDMLVNATYALYKASYDFYRLAALPEPTAEEVQKSLVLALEAAEQKIVTLYRMACPMGNAGDTNNFAEMDETIKLIRSTLKCAKQ